MKLVYFLCIIGSLNFHSETVARSTKNYRCFNKEESKELDKVVQFFESKICDSSEEREKCYAAFFTSEMPRRFVSQDYLWEIQELDSLLNTLPEELRDEIWEVRGEEIFLIKKGSISKCLKKTLF